MKWLVHFLPILVAIAGFILVLMARALTNKSIRDYRQKVSDEGLQKMKCSSDPDRWEKYKWEVTNAFAQPPPYGAIPSIYSSMFTLGLAAMVISLFWSFFCVGWWASPVVIGLLLLLGFFPSLLAPRR